MAWLAALDKYGRGLSGYLWVMLRANRTMSEYKSSQKWLVATDLCNFRIYLETISSILLMHDLIKYQFIKKQSGIP
jgi:hypothetical protein